MKEMKIGATLLFKQITKNKVKGILKSIIISEIKKTKVLKETQDRGQEIATHYEYDYLGINDLFSVSGDIEPNAILGRTSFYDLDSLEKSKTLINKEVLWLEEKDNLIFFNCSLVFFCKSIDEDNYTISVLSVIESSYKEVYNDAKKLGLKQGFQDKIKSNSIEKIVELHFIGIESVCHIDLKFDVFQTFIAEFDNEDELAEELLPDNDIGEIIKDIMI